MRRDDGVDLMVPNSRLLENTVINWTLADPRIRTSIRVGFAYGSPTNVSRRYWNNATRRRVGA
jgi:small-conductance mechanosensitive channel